MLANCSCSPAFQERACSMMVGGGLRGKVCAPSGGNPSSGPPVYLPPTSHCPLSMARLTSPWIILCFVGTGPCLQLGAVVQFETGRPAACSSIFSFCSGTLHVWEPSCCSLYPGKGLLGAKSPSPLLAPSPCLQVYSSFPLPLLIAWDFSESSFLPILP